MMIEAMRKLILSVAGEKHFWESYLSLLGLVNLSYLESSGVDEFKKKTKKISPESGA